MMNVMWSAAYRKPFGKLTELNWNLVGLSFAARADDARGSSQMVASKEHENSSDLIRTISHHSLACMLCAASEMFRHYDFDPLDCSSFMRS
jgi:hypothetical protein